MSSDTDSSASVVFKYYLYRATGNPGFIWPIYTLYILSHGVSFTQIGIIGTIQAVIVVGGEIPTGYVGDRIGRRNSLLVGESLFAVSNLVLIAAEGFVGFAVAFGFISFAETFVSGSADAWLYDVLEERLDGDAYTHVRGRGGAVGKWVMAATMVAGSLLYVADPHLPFYAALAMNAVNGVVTLTLPKSGRHAASEGDDGDDRLTIVDALPVIRRKLTEPPLRSFVAYMALFVGITLTAGAYVQPIAVDALEANAGALLSSLGVPEATSLGVLYASFTVVSAVASDRASDLEAALGVRRALFAVPVLTAVLFVAPAFAPVLAFPMFFGMKAARSLVGPIAGQYLNDRIESVGRATVLSTVSMVYALARIPFSLGSGVVADATSPLVGVAALGATFLVVGVGLFAWRPPVGADGDASAVDGAASGQ